MSDDSPEARDSLEYHSGRDTYRAEFATGDDEPSTTIVQAIAAILDRKQNELDPLYYVIEPDALDSIFQPTVRGDHQSDVEVSFTYHGFDVSVRSYGIVEIEPGDDRATSDDRSE